MEEEEETLDAEELAMEEEVRARMDAEQDGEQEEIAKAAEQQNMAVEEQGTDRKQPTSNRDRGNLQPASRSGQKKRAVKQGKERGTPSPRYMHGPEHHHLARSQSAVEPSHLEQLRDGRAPTEHTLARSRQAWTGSVRMPTAGPFLCTCSVCLPAACCMVSLTVRAITVLVLSLTVSCCVAAI